jgi:hypothetical protein
VAIAARGKRLKVGCVGARPEGRDDGQVDDLLGEEGLELTRWEEVGVGEVVVDAAEAAGAEIADPATLDGRGLAGEGEQAAVRGVAGQIDEDVDAVGLDLRCQLGVREREDAVPVRDVVAQPIGDAVFDGVVGVRMQREAGVAGEFGEHGLDEVRHGVGAKVAGDEADAQRALGVARVCVAWPGGVQRRFEAVGETDVLLEEGLGVDLAAVAEAEE